LINKYINPVKNYKEAAYSEFRHPGKNCLSRTAKEQREVL